MTTKAFELARLGNAYSDGALSNRNFIINGAMQVAQRGTSEAGITGTNGYFTVDRFRAIVGAGTWTMTQESHSDGPDGHRFSAKMEVTSTAAIGSGTGSVRFDYFPEAQDCVHLNYGQSDAKTVTLSFWVKGSTTGTYAIALYGHDAARVIGSTYTVDVADTWEYKTVTFEGDVSGSINADNGRGIEIAWFLSAGSGLTSTDNTSWAAYSTTNYAFGHGVDLANTASGYLQITGVQLEVGDTATPFEHRSFADTLNQCQRYFAKSYNYGVNIGSATYTGMATTTLRENNQGTGYVEKYDFPFPVKMRSNPSITIYDHSGNSGKGSYYEGASLIANRTFTINANSDSQWGAYTDRTTSKGGYRVHWTADAEL